MLRTPLAAWVLALTAVRVAPAQPMHDGNPDRYEDGEPLGREGSFDDSVGESFGDYGGDSPFHPLDRWFDGSLDGPAAPGSALRAPAIADVLAAAYRAAGLDRDPHQGWTRRARLAGLVPWVSVRWGWDADWRDLDPDVQRGTVIDVRATWRLDRLVFDARELPAASLEAARRRERAMLASRVIHAYFIWLAASRRAQGRSLGVRAQEAAAILDDATADWFGEEVLRLQHIASGSRTR